MSSTVRVNLEIGHEASIRTKRTPDGYTHDWEVFVRGLDGADVHHYVEKVVFHLHETFPKPKRVIKEPPYTVKESGYAGFVIQIDVYLKNKDEPKKVRFNYDLHLQDSGPPILKVQKEKYIFHNVSDEFKTLLLKGGGIDVSGSDQSESKSHYDDKKLLLGKPKLGAAEPKKHKPKDDMLPSNDPFQNLFGTPIKTTTKTSSSSSSSEPKAQPKDVNKLNSSSNKDKDKNSEKERSKNKSPLKDKDKEKTRDHEKPAKEKSSDSSEKKKDKDKSREKNKERERSKEKSSKRNKSPRPRSPSPPRRSPKRPPSPPKRPPSPPALPKQHKEGDKRPDSAGAAAKEKEKKSDDAKKYKKDKRDKERDDGRSKAVKRDEPNAAPQKIEKKDAKEEKVKTDEKEKKEKHKHKKKDKEKRKEKDEKHKEKKKEAAAAAEKVNNVPKDDKSLFASPKHEQAQPKKHLKPLNALISEIDNDNSNSSVSSKEEHFAAPVEKIESKDSLFDSPKKPAEPEKVKPKKDKTKKKEKKDKEEKKRKRKQEGKADDEEPEVKQPKEEPSAAAIAAAAAQAVADERMMPAPPPPPPPSEPAAATSEKEVKKEAPPVAIVAPTPQEDPEDYMRILRELQHKIMTLQDNTELQKVVQLIAETGRYEVSARTFDFDLCLLERSTVRRLQEFFSVSSSS